MAMACSQCGGDIEDNTPPGPCPACGSTLRDNRIVIEPGSFVLTGHPVQLVITRQWTILLATADRLFDAAEHGVAVIVAATACEVVVDRAFASAFQKKGVPELDEPIGKLVGTNALVRDPNRKLYNVITGDDMGANPGSTIAFWEGYKTLVEHRNTIAHKGNRIGETDARKDIDSAKQFVEHVVKHNGLE